MIYIAKQQDGTPLLGNEDGIRPLAASDSELRTMDDALRAAASGSLPDPGDATAAPCPIDSVTLSVPLETPGKLWGIGLNYAEHASDLKEERPDEPASFMKPASTVVGPGGPIRLPSSKLTERVTAEAEIGVVIGRRCYGVDADEVDRVIAGYVPIIDMTAEDILERNPRYLTRAKSFDTFLVIGPRIVTPSSIGSLAGISVRTSINDRTIAENTVDNMMMPPRELVSFHSQVMTLEVGDIISTGTPGAGVIKTDDTVTASIDRIGTVSADVVE